MSRIDSIFLLEHPDGSPTSAPLAGDYYFQPENVTRGVTLANADFGSAPLDPQLLGDYGALKDTLYGQEHVDFTSCTWAPLGDFADPVNEGLHGAPVPGVLHTRGMPPKQELCSVVEPPKGLVPPELPTDPFFQLEATAIYLANSNAHAVWHDLLEFFDGHVTASVTKVSPNKFALKADLYSEEHTMCSLKARIYTCQKQDSLVVEFQRREGDGVAFSKGFRHASTYLKSRPGSSCIKEYRVDGPSAFDAGKEAANAPLGPVLDLARLGADQTGPKAEAAAALARKARMALDSGVAMQCAGEALEALKAILEGEGAGVAFPTACALHLMAKLPEAEDGFVQHGLLQLMLEKVRSQQPAYCDQLARSQLAEALRRAATSCAPRLLPAEIAVLRTELRCAAQVETNAQIQKSLQEAFDAL